MSSFGDRFKKLRLSKDLTQDELVEEFNKKYGYSFTKATISQYENNKRIPEINGLMNFAEYFNVSLDYLLCNDTYIIKELGAEYFLNNNDDSIDIENLIGVMKSIINNKVISLNNKKLDINQIKTINNCLDISIELVKRDALDNK